MKQPFEFIYNEDIQIDIPVLYTSYEELTKAELNELHHKCDQISGIIPEKIKEFESTYRELYTNLKDLDSEEDFYDEIDRLNEISRNICELNLWYLRMQGKFLTSSVE